MNDRACCKIDENVKVIKQYDPQPKNKSGSVRWYLYRWDDGKNGYRKLVRCNQCGTLYLVQAYQLHKFSEQRDKWFEDWYLVDNEKKADHWNRCYTGIQLEHKEKAVFHNEK